MNDINKVLEKEFIFSDNLIIRKSNMKKRMLFLLVYLLISIPAVSIVGMLFPNLGFTYTYFIFIIPLLYFSFSFQNTMKLQFLKDTKLLKFGPRSAGVEFSKFTRVVTIGKDDEKIKNAFPDKNNKVMFPNKKDSTYFSVLVLENGYGIYLTQGSKEKCDAVTEIFKNEVVL